MIQKIPIRGKDKIPIGEHRTKKYNQKIQKIPIRGKDKIPIGEHRTKKLQSK